MVEPHIREGALRIHWGEGRLDRTFFKALHKAGFVRSSDCRVFHSWYVPPRVTRELMTDKKEESAQSRMLKAKKCLASMGAKSTVGQKTISHFLGVPGTNLLVALQGAATKDVGEAKAKALIENIYILACKGKVLYDAKIITHQNTKEFVAPVNQTCIAIFLLLEEKRKNPSKQADCTGLALKFAQLESLVINLLKPHIKEKNIEKTKEVFKYFGSKRFLDLFVNNPNFHEYKTTLHRSATRK